MEYSDYLAAQDFIERKALALLNHEKKEFAQVGFPLANYTVYKRGNRTFYGVGTGIFLSILDMHLINAQKTFPLNFGNDNAICVVHAIEKTMALHGGIKNAIRLLKDENCCWIVENKNGNIPDKVLRIDLFRKLDKKAHKKRKYDFTGGLLHALKHFSYRGKPLSTGNEVNDLNTPKQILSNIVNAFFVEAGEFSDLNTYISYIKLNDKYYLRFVFYRESNTNVFFIKSIYKVKVKKGAFM